MTDMRCPECGYEWRGWEGETRINKNHTQTPLTTCRLCQKTFTHKDHQ